MKHTRKSCMCKFIKAGSQRNVRNYSQQFWTNLFKTERDSSMRSSQGIKCGNHQIALELWRVVWLDCTHHMNRCKETLGYRSCSGNHNRTHHNWLAHKNHILDIANFLPGSLLLCDHQIARELWRVNWNDGSHHIGRCKKNQRYHSSSDNHNHTHRNWLDHSESALTLLTSRHICLLGSLLLWSQEIALEG